MFNIDILSYISDEILNKTIVSKRFDFVIVKNNHYYLIETNFYASSGSKLNKTDWYFKIGDPDINPSFPHLHSKDGKHKMNIYNGNIHRVKDKKIVSTLQNNDFYKLWTDKKFREEVIKIRSAYPYGVEKLPPIPDVSDKNHLNRHSNFEQTRIHF